MKNLKTLFATRSIGTSDGALKSPRPPATPTHRASAHTAETWTVRRTKRRRTRKNPQRKQTQDNRRTTQDEKIIPPSRLDEKGRKYSTKAVSTFEKVAARKCPRPPIAAPPGNRNLLATAKISSER